MKVTSESEVAQSCPTPNDRMDCSLPGSSVRGILQARVLEWVAIAFSFGGEWIHVYVLLSPFAVYLKLSQQCVSLLYSNKKVLKLHSKIK